MPSQQTGTAKDTEFNRAQRKILQGKKSLQVIDQHFSDVHVCINCLGGFSRSGVEAKTLHLSSKDTSVQWLLLERDQQRLEASPVRSTFSLLG